MAKQQGGEGSVLIKEGTVIGGRGPIYTTIAALAGGLAEVAIDITSVVGENLVITGFYVEGDGTNDFEFSFKTGAHGSTTWFLVGAAARVASISGVFQKEFFLRSVAATSVKVLLTIVIEPGIPPVLP